MTHKIGKRNGYYYPNLYSVIVNRNLLRMGHWTNGRWEIENIEDVFKYGRVAEQRFIRRFGVPPKPVISGGMP